MLLSNICTDPKNSRKREITPENDPNLLELADSIKRFGDVIEPIIVRLRPEEDISGDYCPGINFMIISGHRRFAAAKLAGLKTVHCSIWENISNEQALEMQLIENLHRADLQPVEEAEAYKRMKEELGYNYAEIALRVGKSEKHIGRYIKLLTLPEEISEMIDKGDLTLSKALFLCSLPEKIVEVIMDRYAHWLDYNLQDFKQVVLRQFIVELSNEHIKFNTKEEYTDDDFNVWPACTKCPHKKQMALFDEFDNKGQCPYAPCFRAKQDLIEDLEEDDEEDFCDEEQDDDSEDDNDNKPPKKETPKEKEQRERYELDRKVRLATERTKALYYIDKKVAQGFSINNLFELTDCEPLDDDNNDFFLKYLGKDITSIKESNDFELVVKAVVIDTMIAMASHSYGEGELCRIIECEQCPDELLEAARLEAMGIKKK
ncbi:MAG: ParB/RepB/Spo0J family partition protein [Fibromonadales bacterium]|nr:ParB/RepB/Spo0J family partition protein [Fibromonadales bacterium]